MFGTKPALQALSKASARSIPLSTINTQLCRLNTIQFFSMHTPLSQIGTDGYIFDYPMEKTSLDKLFKQGKPAELTNEDVKKRYTELFNKYGFGNRISVQATPAFNYILQDQMFLLSNHDLVTLLKARLIKQTKLGPKVLCRRDGFRKRDRYRLTTKFSTRPMNPLSLLRKINIKIIRRKKMNKHKHQKQKKKNRSLLKKLGKI